MLDERRASRTRAWDSGLRRSLPDIEGSSLPPSVVLLGMLFILLFLGCFIDQTSIMMITLPFYMPIIRKMGVDQVWFGIMYLLCMQIGLLTPPFGLLLFVLKGVAPPEVTIGMIYSCDALPVADLAGDLPVPVDRDGVRAAMIGCSDRQLACLIGAACAFGKNSCSPPIR